MKEHEVFWTVTGIILLLGLIFLVYGRVKRRSGLLRRWMVQEVLLVCMLISFGGICITALKSRDAATEVRIIYISGAVILTVGTILISFQVFLERKRIQKLVRAFTESLKGTARMEKKPLFLDREMDTLWSGAWACAREIERMQYQQISRQRLYLRFVPKAVERLFKERDLEGIDAGEYISDTGIIGCITVQTDPAGSKEDFRTIKNQISDVFFKTQEEGQSVFFPQSVDLKRMWGVFLDGGESAVHTGIRLLAGMEESGFACDVTMLLYPSDYTYGITGNRQRVWPYFSAAHDEELLFYADRLRELRVKIAVTEEMAEDFKDSMSLRGIGYIRVSGENQNLYEVLEGYSVSKRRGIERQAGKFAKALALYYRSDFYLARNIFAEVLRECPKDDVAKWYLFACEERLGSGLSADAEYGLFAD
ncbi:MAG: hypothetical protein HFG89_09040 [Dorea sp.]|jgi:hypothetical protein|nr:hypothetical protein [Dorea sp.]